jgi:hypothetical protein
MAGDKLNSEEDKVNHPKHYTYNWEGNEAIEAYAYIRSWRMDYPESNIIKYVTRHPYKGKSLEDLKKARWYLDRLIEEIEIEEGKNEN